MNTQKNRIENQIKNIEEYQVSGAKMNVLINDTGIGTSLQSFGKQLKL